MNRLVKSVRRGAVGLAAALLLASCGGGDPVVDFEPRRLLAFGDETSALLADGRKYTVNAVGDTGALVCTTSPLWIQRLANHYRLVLNECNSAGVSDSPSRVYGTLGAKVADLQAQVQAHIDAGGTFSADDLVTMMIGQNDVLELYEAYVADRSTRAAAVDALRTRGALYAAQVSRVAALGGKVVASTPVDVSYSPFARAQTAADRAVMREMLEAYVEGFRGGLINESGTRVALMLGHELTRLMGRSADEDFGRAYNLSNSSTAVCTGSAVDTAPCTTLTLIDPDNNPATTTSASSYLWADARRIAPSGHNYLGSLAIDRARSNPF